MDSPIFVSCFLVTQISLTWYCLLRGGTYNLCLPSNSYIISKGLEREKKSIDFFRKWATKWLYFTALQHLAVYKAFSWPLSQIMYCSQASGFLGILLSKSLNSKFPALYGYTFHKPCWVFFYLAFLCQFYIPEGLWLSSLILKIYLFFPSHCILHRRQSILVDDFLPIWLPACWGSPWGFRHPLLCLG